VLLEATWKEPTTDVNAWVRKPVFGREGANILLNGTETPGDYSGEEVVWQRRALLPQIEGRYPVIGSWIVEGRAAGMGIRESDGPVTTNLASFVPHFIRG